MEKPAAPETGPSSPAEKLTGRRRFPADIEAEILAWLPVKTLKRFQTACKSWSSLISSLHFANNHYTKAQTKPPRLLTLQSNEDSEFDPDPNSTVGRYPSFDNSWDGTVSAYIHNYAKSLPNDMYEADKLTLRFSAYNPKQDGTLALVNRFSKTLTQPLFDGSTGGKPYMLSCRGLVCLASWSLTNPPIMLYNPATQELISLPPTIEPSICVGFGYVDSTGDFKVVRFFAEGTEKKSSCQVFTLGTNKWRKAKNLPYRACDGTSPFLNGAVHCLPETSVEGVQETDVISVFDMKTEAYREAIPLPEYYHSLGSLADHKRRGIIDVRNFMRLTILGGSLCLTFDFGELKCRLELWLLKDYDNTKWVKWQTINVSSIYPYPSFSFWAYPTDNWVDNNIMLNCTDERGIKLLGYDPRRKVLKLMRDNEWAATYYEETLYSPRLKKTLG